MKYSTKRKMKDLNNNLEIVEEKFEGSFQEITELMKFSMQQEEYYRIQREEEEKRSSPSNRMGFKVEEEEEDKTSEEEF